MLAIEWQHCECCTLWPWPSFLRSNIFLLCTCYKKLRRQRMSPANLPRPEFAFVSFPSARPSVTAHPTSSQLVVVFNLVNIRLCNIISKRLHGFCLYTITDILELIADWTFTLRKTNTQLYVDFAKAFDTVCHDKLFHKLRSLCINSNLLMWIQDLLTNRTQRTRIGTSLSGSCNVYRWRYLMQLYWHIAVCVIH